VIDRQANQIKRLLDDLLDISRITQQKIDLKKSTFDLRQTADDAVLAVRSAATSHEVKLDVDVPGEPLYVHGDAARLQQVQVNLLVNAVKYTPPGGRIDFSLRRRGDEVRIRVRDTGVGMSKELQRRVFEMFVQGNETLDRSEGGMGVGLTLVRTLVQMHGGTVRARSAGPGKGSEFVVDLPLSQPPAQPADAPDAPEPAACDTTHLELLIVEDEDDARDMLRMLLETYGYHVTAAADGLAALRAMEVERPDVAFIDIGLPELDGYGVARRVRKTDAIKAMHLVALTGYGQPADRKKARDAGFDDHLTKPVQMDALFRILEQVARCRNDSAACS
jgi:two-component system CheB/CheR fusion protein